MSGASAAVVEVILARMRAETRGGCAALFTTDHALVAIDAAAGAADAPGWRGIVCKLTVLFRAHPDLCERDFTLSAEGTNGLVFFLAGHGVLVVEVRAAIALGLARVGVRPLVEELARALNGGTSGGGEGVDARVGL